MNKTGGLHVLALLWISSHHPLTCSRPFLVILCGTLQFYKSFLESRTDRLKTTINFSERKQTSCSRITNQTESQIFSPSWTFWTREDLIWMRLEWRSCWLGRFRLDGSPGRRRFFRMCGTGPTAVFVWCPTKIYERKREEKQKAVGVWRSFVWLWAFRKAENDFRSDVAKKSSPQMGRWVWDAPHVEFSGSFSCFLEYFLFAFCCQPMDRVSFSRTNVLWKACRFMSFVVKLVPNQP